MVTVEQAKELILSSAKTLPVININVEESLGYVTAKDIYSAINYPPFNQSDKDGFAFNYNALSTPGNIRITGKSIAGNKPGHKLSEKEAVRIFTGVPIPDGADTVVMQENASVEKDSLIIHDTLLKKGDNFRAKGAQFREGEIVLPAGTNITPGCIGCIAGLGIKTISAYRKPIVSIIATGNELQEPGNKLEQGQVYNSNTHALGAALSSIGIKNIDTYKAPDDMGKITKRISLALSHSDVVLVTGGISVGDYDYVGEAFKQLGVESIFYKVSQKPGKPLFFGRKGDALAFGLPGNPTSSLLCFYEYVLPAIRKQCGNNSLSAESAFLPIAADYNKNAGYSEYVRAIVRGQKAVPVSGQESFKTHSFALAECLIYLPADKSNIKEGEQVEIHKIPGI
ncbi:MAG: gephyrin-like molybdotransferase Glp [Bacteroidia bacterium]